MKRKLIQKAVDMGNRVGYVLVATSDSTGLPHIAASRRIEAEPEDHVALSEWFCPGTVSNLDANPKISLVVWDPATDRGFQLIGESVGIEETAMLDGLSTTPHAPIPQVERKIRIWVDKILDFSHGPHTDKEEEEG